MSACFEESKEGNTIKKKGKSIKKCGLCVLRPGVYRDLETYKIVLVAIE